VSLYFTKAAPVPKFENNRTPVIGEGVTIAPNSVLGPKKRVAPLKDAHRILITGNFKELGYDRNNVYFIEI
jgi:hypothetical protein